ncbi:MAG: hypothetical protein AAF799_24465 [Myxococcota bacterium]
MTSSIETATVPWFPGRATTTRLLETVTEQWWGFRPNLLPHIVEEKGSLSVLLWTLRTMPRYERIREHWGPVRLHLIATTISILDRCAYCTHGHAMALQLHYLLRFDHLFPLDEATISGLRANDDFTIITALELVLIGLDLESEVALLHRTAELRDGATPHSADDHRICQLIEMLGFLGSCATRSNVAIDEAHDPINENTAIRRRYADLRAAEG